MQLRSIQKVSLAIGVGIAAASQAWAEPSQAPLLGRTATAQPTNLLVILDDSGSMRREYAPESLGKRLDADDNADKGLNDTAAFVIGDTFLRNRYNVINTRNGDLLAAKMRGPANKIYYNPSIRYLPWVNPASATFAPMADQNPQAAWINPRIGAAGGTIDLTTARLASFTTYFCAGAPGAIGTVALGADETVRRCTDQVRPNNLAEFYAPTYYELRSPELNPDVADNYRRVRINIDFDDVAGRSYHRPLSRLDCNAGDGVGGRLCTGMEELVNFANWFTYYRTRSLTMAASLGHAILATPPNTRLGYGLLNQPISSVDGRDTPTIVRGVRPFNGDDKIAFFAFLYSDQFIAPQGANSTPLRRALSAAGVYYSRPDDRGPWGENPGRNGGVQAPCRRCITLLVTDGTWNDAGPGALLDTAADGDWDGKNLNEITGPARPGSSVPQRFQYLPGPPYKDGATNKNGSLADLAMYYWANDLRTNLDNVVPTTRDDNAFWQHMTTYTLGFGVSGRLPKTAGTWADLLNGRAYHNLMISLGRPANNENWPPSFATAYSADKIDDLWHAAVNGHGQYQEASTPSEIKAFLAQMLAELPLPNAGSSAGVSTSKDSYAGGNSTKFVTQYSSDGWWGDLVARTLSNSGGVAVEQQWSAANKMPVPEQRKIYMGLPAPYETPVPANLVPPGRIAEFVAPGSDPLRSELSRLWTSYGYSDVASAPTLRPAALISYLRGDNAYEGNGFRPRTRAGGQQAPLGDFINSRPTYIGEGVDLQYGFLPDSLSEARGRYRAHLNRKKSRTDPLVFVGANDGMLHAFDATSGVERFAYIPNVVVSKLPQLSSTAYAHQYYVDGPLMESDAYWGGNWHNVLFGATGAGGRSVFLLDITQLSAAHFGSRGVVWELTAERENDLGYVFESAEIGVMPNGRWVAMFGNGMDSATRRAVLYIVDIESREIRKIVAGSAPPIGEPASGLGGVRAVRDKFGVIVGAYAGDLKGNLWRFDLQSASPSDWRVGFGGAPLIRARNAAGTPLPIVAAPEVLPHPKSGSLVTFGTGKFYSEEDLADNTVQNLYGVWDRTVIGAASIAAHAIPDNASLAVRIVRQSSSTNLATAGYVEVGATGDVAVNWERDLGWKMTIGLENQRAIFTPQVVRDYVMFQTMGPKVASNAGLAICDGTPGDGYNLFINPFGGVGPDAPIFPDAPSTPGNILPPAGYKTLPDGQDAIQLGGRGGGGGGGGGDDCIQNSVECRKVRIPRRPVEIRWRQLMTAPHG